MKLYNTMSRCIEDFNPRDGNNVKIFTCGPSIYQKAHIGNFRTFLYEDLLVRYLTYKGYAVERAMNLTDIEDKAISEAKKHQTNVKALTDNVLLIFRQDLNGFGFIMPDHLIAASESVSQAVKIIQNLVKKGIAYEYKGDYFFDPLKVNNFGKLFKLDMEQWPKTKRRYKKDTYSGNRWNKGDFILWHSHKNDPDHPYWDTEIGRGRPSWNIQDPSVVIMSVGEYVDINCGGIDNIYRHHDYNIAIMEAYTEKTYANYYMHGEHLVIDGKTMSKSKGNIVYPEDLAASGIDWRDIRFFLTYKHYREKLNYTEANFNKATAHLSDFRTAIGDITSDSNTTSTTSESTLSLIESIPSSFENNLDNDLSLGAGFDEVFRIIRTLQKLNKNTPLNKDSIKKLNNNLKKIDNVLNVIYPLKKLQ